MVIVEWTTIPVTKEVAGSLRGLGKKGETYDIIIRRLIGGVDWQEVAHAKAKGGKA